MSATLPMSSYMKNGLVMAVGMEGARYISGLGLGSWAGYFALVIGATASLIGYDYFLSPTKTTQNKQQYMFHLTQALIGVTGYAGLDLIGFTSTLAGIESLATTNTILTRSVVEFIGTGLINFASDYMGWTTMFDSEVSNL